MRRISFAPRSAGRWPAGPPPTRRRVPRIASEPLAVQPASGRRYGVAIAPPTPPPRPPGARSVRARSGPCGRRDTFRRDGGAGGSGAFEIVFDGGKSERGIEAQLAVGELRSALALPIAEELPEDAA